MTDLAIYLRLTAEFGGTRFGPFEHLETRLGSDEDRCHIVLPESLGILPVHCQVMRQGDTNTIVAPADRAATLYLWRAESRRPTQITSPTALRSGDGFSLVTADGPRFIMEIAALPEKMQEERDQKRKRATHGRGRLNKESMGAEAKRQAWSSVLTQAPAQMAQRAWTFVTSGAIYQPRNIFIAVMLLGGWILGGAMMCSSGKQQVIAQTWEKRYGDCDVQRQNIQKIYDKSLPDLTTEELVLSITGSNALSSYLDADPDMRKQVEDQARIITKEDYSWLLDAKGEAYNDFKRWRDAVFTSESLDNDTRKLVVWLASRRNLGRGEWQTTPDYQGDAVCTRGPLQITRSMAANLGMTYQFDDLFLGGAGEIDDGTELVDHMSQVFEAEGIEIPEDMQVDKAKLDEGFCVFVEGEDDRQSNLALIGQINKSLGKNATRVPDPESNAASIARVAKFWSSAFGWGAYARGSGLDFAANKNVSGVLDTKEIQGGWVKKQTARTIAQAIMLPCLVQMYASEDADKILGPEGEGITHPDMVSCVYLTVKLDNL